MTQSLHPTPWLRLRDRVARIGAARALALKAIAVAQAAVILNPALPGEYAEGPGANATFVRIDGSWTGSSVYSDEQAKTFKNNHAGNGFQPVGSFSWGTGI